MHYNWNFIAIRVTFFIISTLIGAGFASGQELLQFFLVFNNNGTAGVIIASILLALLSWRLISLSQLNKLHTYAELVQLLPQPFQALFTITIPLFLFLMLIALLTAFTAIATEYCQLTASVGTGLFILIIGVVSMTGHTGFILLNLVIAPLLISGIIMTSLHSSLYHHTAPLVISFSLTTLTNESDWLTACLLYTGYNSIPLMTALIPFSTILPPAQTAIKRGCLGGGLAFLLLSLLCLQALLLHQPAITEYELPMLSVSCSQHFFCFIIYLTLIIAAIFSTAVNAALNCASLLSRSMKLSFNNSLLLTLLVCLPFYKLNFSTIIQYGFPAFGLAGLLLMTLLCLPAKT